MTPIDLMAVWSVKEYTKWGFAAYQASEIFFVSVAFSRGGSVVMKHVLSNPNLDQQ